MKAKIILLLLIVMLPLVVYGNAAGETAGDRTRHAIEISALSQEQKAGLINISDEALKAGIPADDSALIVSRGLARGWGDKALKESFSLLITAQKRGLPTGPLIDRLHQGASKGVPFEKVFISATRLTDKLSAADGLVANLMRAGLKANRGEERAGAVGTVARALERSIPEGEMTTIGSKMAKHKDSVSHFDAAVSAMTTFVDMGVPMEECVRLMNKAVDKGYSEKEMMKMERDMTRGMKEGRKFEDMMRRMESTMGGRGMSGMGSGPGMHGDQGPHGGSGMSGQGMGGGSGPGSGPGMGNSPGMGGDSGPGSGPGMGGGGMDDHGGNHGM